ncbi:MAG: ammonium transporter [Actinomycetota bacterium]
MNRKLLITVAGSLGLLVAFASPASAQMADDVGVDLSVLTDNLFVFVCAIFVVFMQAGFAMVEAGLTRAKNAAHMMLKNLLDFTVGALGFALIGYHIAYSGAGYFGFEWAWGAPDARATAAPNLTMPVHFLFNMAFAAAAATIVSGAVAERVKFRAYFIYAVAISSFIYPVVVNWAWGGGWLGSLDTPFIDFAGGTVVHVTGGMCALMGAKIAGPRIGRYRSDGTANPIPGHNVPLAILGVFILLISWFAFNTGSLLTVELQLGSIAANTAVGAAAGAVGALITAVLTVKTPDVTLVGNGLLGGLVAITAGALNLSVFGSMVVGFSGGVIATLGVLALDRFRIDDPVGAIPVHLMAGVWGTIALGLFADPDAVVGGDGPAGFLYGGDASQLVAQLTGVGAIVAFTGVCAGTMFLVMRERGQLRVSPEEEMLGMDLTEHATPAYNDDVVGIDAFVDEWADAQQAIDRASSDSDAATR